MFTCQNNLRYSVEKNECDWAINVDCNGKPDYMWEGIKENFCKRLVCILYFIIFDEFVLSENVARWKLS